MYVKIIFFCITFNLMYRSNITRYYSDQGFIKVVNAAINGENELLAVISSGISVKNMVNHYNLI